MTKEVIDRDPRIFFELILDRVDVYMLEQHDPAKAYAYVSEVIETYPDDPELLSWIGERIATNPQIPDSMRDMDVALVAVQAARTNGRPNDPRFVASEAEVRFHRGEYDRCRRVAGAGVLPVHPPGARTLPSEARSLQKQAGRDGETRRRLIPVCLRAG